MQEDRDSWVVDPYTQVELRVPQGTTPEQAIRRAARQRAGELYEVRLLPEHGLAWPVWRVGRGLTSESEFALSDELRAELRSWVAFWEAHVNLDGDWSSDMPRDQWVVRKKKLMAELEIELWDVAYLVGD